MLSLSAICQTEKSLNKKTNNKKDDPSQPPFNLNTDSLVIINQLVKTPISPPLATPLAKNVSGWMQIQIVKNAITCPDNKYLTGYPCLPCYNYIVNFSYIFSKLIIILLCLRFRLICPYFLRQGCLKACILNCFLSVSLECSMINFMHACIVSFL